MNNAASESSQDTWSRLIPGRTDRALLVGQTGSGKTTLARYLLNSRQFKLVLDYKGRIDWPEYTLCRSVKELTKSKHDALLYRPNYFDSQDEETCNKLWEWIYQRGGTTVYVDETAAVTQGNVYPYFYGACLMRGRELGIELWSATQRPTSIPSIVLSESEYYYAFRLQLPQDRERVEALTGIRRQSIAELSKRRFLFKRQDGDVEGPLELLLPSNH